MLLCGFARDCFFLITAGEWVGLDIEAGYVSLLKYGMSKVIAYQNNGRMCFCQIKFASREKVLISVASVPQQSIKVIKLFAGIIPYKTIWTFSVASSDQKTGHEQLTSMFTDQAATKVKHPLDAIMLKLLQCRSCDEAYRTLMQAEAKASAMTG